MSSYREDDVFKILLATDCHLGYLENDPVRGNDSVVTFEEILKIAIEKEVDFILLGGDLFHENKPSRKVLVDCMSLLRKYCMGDRPIEFEFLSDQSENFKHCAFPTVNFEDSNLNVSVPVFSIHGNHDDPAGGGCFCTLDILSASGLVNYFGKCVDLESISISPLMLQKGKTKLCLYGLGSIRDERLHRMFLDGKVSMLRPKENEDDWFNVMVLHQNRTKHGVKNYIPEQFLEDFLDLVVWGHEHECRIDKEWNDKQKFFVTQPGSSVATSLCQGEAVKKHVGLLEIKGKEFQITKIPLQTVRQFYIKDIDLEETSLNLQSPDSQEKVLEYCNEIVDQFIEKAEEEHTGNPKQPKLPLVRLRIFYPYNFDPFSVHRFGHSFVSKVANNKDIILFSRKKAEKLKATGIDNDIFSNIMKQEGFERKNVEDLVKKYFEQSDDLLVLSEIGISSAVKEYVDKEVKEAIAILIKHQMNKTQNHLKEKVLSTDDIEKALIKFREERKKNSQSETTEFQVIMKNTHTTKRNTNVSDDEFEEETVEITASKRGRGRGRGTRGTRGGRGRSSAANDASTSKRATSRTAKDVEENGTKRTRTTAPRKASNRTDLSSYFRSSNDNVVEDDEDIVESDDDSRVKSKRARVSVKNTSRRQKGVSFDFSDSE